MWNDVRAVLFDFDGTLVAPTIDFGAMRRAVLDVAHGFGLDTREYAPLPALEIIARAHEVLCRRTNDGAAAFEAQAQRAILAIELEAADRAWPYPGVAGALLRLERGGIQVGIVTRNCRVAVEGILARAPLCHQVLLTRDDVPYVKPDPRHLAAALEHLGAPAEVALMCGDHPMDVLAGQRAGLRTVGVLAPGSPADHFATMPPDIVVQHVDAVPLLLGLDGASG